MTELNDSYRFFRERAGYVVGENAKGAIALARAESAAYADGFVFAWEEDQFADADTLGDHAYWCPLERMEAKEGINFYHSWRSPHTHEIETCRMASMANPDDGPNELETVAALGGIIDADRHYRRIIEAELALEYYAEHGRQLRLVEVSA